MDTTTVHQDVAECVDRADVLLDRLREVGSAARPADLEPLRYNLLALAYDCQEWAASSSQVLDRLRQEVSR